MKYFNVGDKVRLKEPMVNMGIEKDYINEHLRGQVLVIKTVRIGGRETGSYTLVDRSFAFSGDWLIPDINIKPLDEDLFYI